MRVLWGGDARGLVTGWGSLRAGGALRASGRRSAPRGGIGVVTVSFGTTEMSPRVLVTRAPSPHPHRESV